MLTQLKNNISIILTVALGVSIGSNFYLVNKIDKVPTEVSVQVDSSVQKIYKAIKEAHKPVKVVTANLQHKGGAFFYFEGKLKEKSIKITDNYQYDVNYPNEVWDGYWTYAEGTNGTEFYVWSAEKLEMVDRNLAGWFLTDGLNVIEHIIKRDTAYLQVIYPIVERKSFIK